MAFVSFSVVVCASVVASLTFAAVLAFSLLSMKKQTETKTETITTRASTFVRRARVETNNVKPPRMILRYKGEHLHFARPRETLKYTSQQTKPTQQILDSIAFARILMERDVQSALRSQSFDLHASFARTWSLNARKHAVEFIFCVCAGASLCSKTTHRALVMFDLFRLNANFNAFSTRDALRAAAVCVALADVVEDSGDRIWDSTFDLDAALCALNDFGDTDVSKDDLKRWNALLLACGNFALMNPATAYEWLTVFANVACSSPASVDLAVFLLDLSVSACPHHSECPTCLQNCSQVAPPPSPLWACAALCLALNALNYPIDRNCTQDYYATRFIEAIGAVDASLCKSLSLTPPTILRAMIDMARRLSDSCNVCDCASGPHAIGKGVFHGHASPKTAGGTGAWVSPDTLVLTHERGWGAVDVEIEWGGGAISI